MHYDTIQLTYQSGYSICLLYGQGFQLHSTSMFDQIGHTQRFEDDRYQADMMVRRVTNLEVVALGYGDAIADGTPDFATIVLFILLFF